MIFWPNLRASLVVVLAASTASCIHTGAASRHPEIPKAEGYTSQGETLQPSAHLQGNVPVQNVELGAAVTDRWWTLFRSSQLDVLVKEAIAGSRTLESAKARLIAEQEAVRSARSALFPSVDFGANAAREKQSAAAFGLPANAFPLPPNYNLYQVGLTAAYRVDVFGQTRYRIEQQAALAELQRYQLQAAYVSLTGNTVLEAIQLAAGLAQLQALDTTLAIDRQTLELVRKERDVGMVPDLDVIRAENQLATDETLLPGLQQQVSTARHAIAVLLGRAPSEWSPPELALTDLQLPSQLRVSLPSELAHQRPDILAAEAQVHAAAAEIGLATAQLFPDINLSAAINTTGLRVADLFDPAGLVWSIAAGLSQPVFDAGMRRAQRRAALASFRAAAADYQQTVLQAFAQVGDILQALVHDTNLMAAQKRALDTASRSVSLQRTNYEKGGTGILDLLDAQRQYQQALLGYVRAQAQRYLDTVQLQVALGGGSPEAAGD